ncbi:MAG: nitroreductase family protein [Microthrixaceae bacterium]
MTDVRSGPSFAEVLAARRMCRDFLRDPIDPDVLDTVLRAAFRGPAAGNTDALDLLVLRGEHAGEYWDVTLPRERRDAFRWPGLLHAPVLVVPIVRAEAYVERYGRSDKSATGLGDGVGSWSVPYWFVDGGAAVMALLLAAEAEGLGALLFGQFDHEPALALRFGIPPDRRALGTIALGHPAPGGRAPSRSARGGRPDVAHRVHAERW